MSTEWTDTVIWWHCYPLGFVGGEARSGDLPPGVVRHRLGRLHDWLGYVVELGCNGLLLAPVFHSTSHGYDTLDYYDIDPRLGDLADFDALVADATGRGLRILLDGVFNHVSREHPLVTRALAAGPDSAAGRWLKWVEGYPYCFEGNLDLVELDLTHPPVIDEVVAVMSHWIARGVDGWRLDAAFAPGAAAWRPIVERVKAAHPDAWILAEVLTDDFVEFVAASGVDSVTQYELWKAIWSSMNDVNLHELAWALTRHTEFQKHFRPQTFVGNHDVTRIATKLHDPRHVMLAAALVSMLPGVPSIYAGDEQGFTAEKLDQPHGDNPVRPPFPPTPQGLLPYGAPIHAAYRRLIGIRRRHPWLVDATASVREVTNESIVIDLVGGGAGQRLALALNVGGMPRRVDGALVAPHDFLVLGDEG